MHPASPSQDQQCSWHQTRIRSKVATVLSMTPRPWTTTRAPTMIGKHPSLDKHGKISSQTPCKTFREALIPRCSATATENEPQPLAPETQLSVSPSGSANDRMSNRLECPVSQEHGNTSDNEDGFGNTSDENCEDTDTDVSSVIGTSSLKRHCPSASQESTKRRRRHRLPHLQCSQQAEQYRLRSPRASLVACLVGLSHC